MDTESLPTTTQEAEEGNRIPFQGLAEGVGLEVEASNPAPIPLPPKRGRGIQVDPPTPQQIKALAANGIKSIEQAVACLGFSRGTLYNMFQDKRLIREEFEQALADGHAELTLKLNNKMINHALTEDTAGAVAERIFLSKQGHLSGFSDQAGPMGGGLTVSIQIGSSVLRKGEDGSYTAAPIDVTPDKAALPDADE